MLVKVKTFPLKNNLFAIQSDNIWLTVLGCQDFEVEGSVELSFLVLVLIPEL